MRKLTFGVANSLDPMLARSDHSVDWLRWGPEAAAVTREFWKTVDTVLMGRKTFEAATKGGRRKGYPGVANIVFSSMLAPDSAPGVTIVADDAVAFTRELKTRDGRGICLMGGGELARSFLEAGLVDEIGLNIHPVLLGRGIPLFHAMDRQIDLALKECRPFKNGCIYALYRVIHSP